MFQGDQVFCQGVLATCPHGALYYTLDTYHSTLHSCPFFGPSSAPGIHLAQLEQLELPAASGRWQMSLHVSQNPQFPSLRQYEQLLPLEWQEESVTLRTAVDTELFPFVK